MRLPANPRSSNTHRVRSARRESLASGRTMLDHSHTANAAQSVYRLRRCILSMAYHVRAAFIFFCLAAASMVRAGDMCPAPPKYRAPSASDIAADDHRIHVDSDDAALDAEGNAILNGRVKV